MHVIACGRPLARLSRDRRGTSLLEFALGLPILMALGGYGVEIANLALVNLRVSQIALQLADNASRIGVSGGAATYQLREADLNDVLQGARLIGTGIKLTTYGRVTVSSLENIAQTYSDHATDTSPVQRIHWQRCMGKGVQDASGTILAGYDSSYGTTATTSGVDAAYANRGTTSSGMGSPVVIAPSGAGVIFVEVNYKYQPLFGTLYVTPPKIRYVASTIVRDRRDFSRIYSPTPASGTPAPVASTCNRYTV